MSEHPQQFVKNHDKEFSHNRKLSFEKFMHPAISIRGDFIQSELFKYFDYDANTASVSVNMPHKIVFFLKNKHISVK